MAVGADGAGQVKDEKQDDESDDGCPDEQTPAVAHVELVFSSCVQATSLRLVASHHQLGRRWAESGKPS